MSRPLLQKSIAELEQLFQEWRDSPEKLRTLKAELDHRKRPKAVRLLERVEALLAGGGATTDVPPQATQKEFWAGARDEPGQQSGKHQGPSRRSSASTNNQDYLDPPSEFTIVQPMGAK